ncbi:hypothetical protein [Bacillus sp. RS11]|uniref:hypothetical protein n=1 Tax=Lysinibacillus sp. RS11 TaxID=3242682 RepID=UPI0035C692CF
MLKEAGVPEEFVSMLVMIQKGIREGGLEGSHSDLQMLLGRKPTTRIQWLFLTCNNRNE